MGLTFYHVRCGIYGQIPTTEDVYVTAFILHIFQVDMDMEDDLGDALPPVQGREVEKVVDSPVREDASRVL